MSVGSTNDSSSHGLLLGCFDARVGTYVLTVFTATNIILTLPLVIFVLHVGLQRRWQTRSAVESSADIITYQVSAMEITSILCCILYCIGIYGSLNLFMKWSTFVFLISTSGQISFHTLACVERYLAVVHPIMYMHGKDCTIRDILIWSVWLMAFAELGIIALNNIMPNIILYLVHQSISFAVISFCSFATLRVLRQPSVGGKVKQRVDQSKQKAFNTIMTIMSMLVLRIVGNLVCVIIIASKIYTLKDQCMIVISILWFGLPSSLVLPLQFLQRAGKLPSCNYKAGCDKQGSEVNKNIRIHGKL